MKLFVFLALAVAAASAATTPLEKQTPVPVKDIQGRITNGYNAYEGKVPYIVGLLFAGNGNWWCGGSIIGNTWVLTAAHCTNGAESVTINYGASFRTQPQYTHWVHRNDIVQHHHYNSGNLHNDISLIRTPHVDFWHLVNKVELPSFNDRYNSYAGAWAVASGWGGTYDGSPLPDWLQCVDVQIMDQGECSRTWSLHDNMICINTNGGKSTCGGDSGGPLVTHDGNRLVGVTSFGSAAGCQSGHPAVFSRVTGYLEWIRDNTGISY
ncbi:serine protease 1-like [Drosophila obscura]|uniref:serine protease 1-like n=1 Tax=Drosophila obscura TaxID=7282 RepID=UPI000B9FD3A0|nr:serine protease 1-like [Drosophila obscura]